MADQSAPGPAPSWPELCRVLNGRHAQEGSWWRRLADDPESVIRVDDDGVAVRLRGNLFADIRLADGEPQCRMEPGHLLLTHPGGRTVLGRAEAPVRSVLTLGELSDHYDLVRRRACRHTDRRQAVVDRLYLRHSCILAVDTPLPACRADLVALSPAGLAVFVLLRRYADADLRLKGRGGIVWRMGRLDRWLADRAAAAAWVRGLLERCAALDTIHSRRYRFPDAVSVYPFARLLIVDFDHAQRLHGLPSLRDDLEHGLDRSGARSDIHCLGDAGNISFGTFFSGI